MILQNDQITVLTQVHMIVVNLLLLFQDVTYSESAPLIKPEWSLNFQAIHFLLILEFNMVCQVPQVISWESRCQSSDSSNIIYQHAWTFKNIVELTPEKVQNGMTTTWRPL